MSIKFNIKKTQPTSSDIHIPTIPQNKKKKASVESIETSPDANPKLNNIGKKEDDENLSNSTLDKDEIFDFQRLIEGMDWELTNTTKDKNQARENAIDQLTEDPEFYRKLTLSNPFDYDKYLNLDLGSGNARAKGFIGIDKFNYDHATLNHDLNNGIPFPDNTVKTCKAIDILSEVDDPQKLLSEIERVLIPGGILEYQGRVDIDGDPERHNKNQSLILTNYEDNINKSDGTPKFKQEFLKMAMTDTKVKKDQGNLNPIELNAFGSFWDDLKNRVNKSAIILKSNEMKQIVYGVVLSPDEIDFQDDFMTAEDIEKSAHSYLIKSRVVGKQHEEKANAEVVESYIAPQDLEFKGQNGPQKVKKGSWVIGVKVLDLDLWDKILEGEISGFSVGGFGERE